MANYFMAIDENGKSLGSCFPESDESSNDKNSFNESIENANSVLEEIFKEGTHIDSDGFPQIIKSNNPDVNIIDTDRFGIDQFECRKITIIICRGDWRTKIGFENRLTKYGANYWLQCWDVNELTIFITPSWENDGFYKGHNYIKSYIKNGRHNVAVFMWDKKNKLIRKYPE
jgi:hypothetical protein